MSHLVSTYLTCGFSLRCFLLVGVLAPHSSATASVIKPTVFALPAALGSQHQLLFSFPCRYQFRYPFQCLFQLPFRFRHQLQLCSLHPFRFQPFKPHQWVPAREQGLPGARRLSRRKRALLARVLLVRVSRVAVSYAAAIPDAPARKTKETAIPSF